jgi:hypothetical protein
MEHERFMTVGQIQVTQGMKSTNFRQHCAVWLSASAALQAKGAERLTAAMPDKEHPETWIPSARMDSRGLVALARNGDLSG